MCWVVTADARERRRAPRKRRWFSGALPFASALIALTADASAEQVRLVSPPDASPLLTEAFHRLRGELAQHGFEVVIVSARPASTPAALRRGTGHALASIALAEGQTAATVDIWVDDAATGKTTLRSIRIARGEDAAALLALRALELLRASLSELEQRPRSTPDVLHARPQRAAASARALTREEHAGWSAGVGAALVTNLPGAATGLSTTLDFGRRGGWWSLRGELALPALPATLHAPSGRAELRSTTLSLTPALQLWSNDALRLSAVLTLGAQRLSVEGIANPNYLQRTSASWGVATGGGVELQWSVGVRWSLVLASRAAFAWQPAYALIGAERLGLAQPQLQQLLLLRMAPFGHLD